MSTKRPQAKRCVAVIEHEVFSISLMRVGKGPLVEVWVHEHGNGGRGIILTVDESDTFIDAWQNLLDEIDLDMQTQEAVG